MPSRFTAMLTPLSTGVTMAARALGPLDADPVVFVHGLTNSSGTWLRTMCTLRDLLPNVPLAAIDVRGHGHTTLPDDNSWALDPVAAFSIDTLVADLAAWFDAHHISRAVLVGHSMGSMIAQQFALTHPDRVTSLVLVSTTSDATATPILTDWLWDTVLTQDWPTRAAAAGLTAVDAMRATPLTLDPDGAITWMQTFWNVYPACPGMPTKQMAIDAARLPLAVWTGATRTVLDFTSASRLPHLQTPVLALWGSQDAFFRHDDQRDLLTALTGRTGPTGAPVATWWKQYGTRPLDSSGLQTDDLGHNLTLEVPHAIASDIASWMTTGVPSPTSMHIPDPQNLARIASIPAVSATV